MYNLRFPLISLHDYDNAFNEHILVFACSTYLVNLSVIADFCRYSFSYREYFFVFREYSSSYREYFPVFRDYSSSYREYFPVFREYSPAFR